MLYAADGSGTCADLHHRVELPPDDGSPVTFKWHFPREVLTKRMSALEIKGFLIRHMDPVAGMLSDNPRIHIEFMALRNRMVFTPDSKLDEILPWVQVQWGTEADAIVQLKLGKDVPTPPRPFWMVMRDSKPVEPTGPVKLEVASRWTKKWRDN